MKVSPEILNLVPYSPGKPIEETKREFGLKTVYKLASNENPLGPSAAVTEAITQALKDIHRYPDASCFEMGEAVGQYWGVKTSQLVFGNGSNELIDLLIRIYCEPGDAILTSQAAFIAYKICAQAARVKTIETPLTTQLCFDLTAMANALSQPNRIRLVFIANPNNPTGTYVSGVELEAFLQLAQSREVLVVLDEAYVEFVRAKDYRQGLEFFKKFSNVICLRTMSKVYGLAGLRVGCVVAPDEVVDLMHRVRNPFNVNSLAQVAVKAALSDKSYIQRVQEVTWSGLDWFYSEFKRLGITYWPSQANFVLIDCQRDSEKVFKALLKRGIIVRPVKNYGFNRHLRLSVGLPEENRLAMQALESVLTEVQPES